ncbi:MAG TPA: MbcA/ParS/Xre antitoxin family protein [Acetobacteraceae bacterium]|nr:MbcA/ParS/Xre antitoxin family protein [Acetobacteraceae bacterium]
MDTMPGAMQPGPDRRALSPAALRAFYGLASLWKLSVQEQMTLLGVSARSTFFHWKKHPEIALPKDTLERISYLLGIYKALQILLPEASAADAWVRRPNQAPLFGGGSALDRMLSGHVADLFEVRRYLDAQRGGWA